MRRLKTTCSACGQEGSGAVLLSRFASDAALIHHIVRSSKSKQQLDQQEQRCDDADGIPN